MVGAVSLGYAAAEAGPAPVLPIGVYCCGPFVFLKSVG